MNKQINNIVYLTVGEINANKNRKKMKIKTLPEPGTETDVRLETGVRRGGGGHVGERGRQGGDGVHHGGHRRDSQALEVAVNFLGWKLLSCSQCQELGQRANLAPDWFFVFRQPIRSQVNSLT